jgi:glycerophosphoryl diester phosphodiesterase
MKSGGASWCCRTLPLPRWFAHRGGGNLAPENTLAGIRRAAGRGCRAVEFDVMLSADGTPVLIHDETLERTTNGHGRVAETPDTVLRALDAGDGERIPTLAEAALLCRQFGLLANIEIKPATGYEIVTAEVVARQARELWRGSQVQPLLSSFSMESLAVAKAQAPDLPRGALYEKVPADWGRQADALSLFSLHAAAVSLGDEVLHEAGERGLPVLAYTVNDREAAARLFARRVAGLFSDNPDLFTVETSVCNSLHPSG